MLGLDMENVRLKSHDKAHRRSAIFIQRRQERSLRLSGKKLMFSVVLSDKIINKKHSYTQQTTVESSVQRISIRCGYLIPVVETGKVYHIIPIQVRTWNGVKKLTTTPSSVVTEVVDQPELNGIPLRESTNNDQEAANVVITVPSIHSVHSVETFVHCINCGRRLVHATAGKFVQCPRCGTYMRTTNCSTKKCARIVVQSDDNLLHLTAFEDVLKEACPDLPLMSEGTLAELLLDMNNVTITYDASNRTIKKISLQK